MPLMWEDTGKKDHEDEYHREFSHLSIFSPLLVYYLSEVIQECLESIFVNITIRQQRS